MNKRTFLVAIGLVFLQSLVLAAAPKLVPVQGYLTGANGQAIEGQVSLTFGLHPSEDSPALLFSETQSVNAEDGLFAVYLGAQEELDLSLFRDYTTLFLSISINGGPELEPRIGVGTGSFAGFAQYSGDAQTLQGHSAADFAAVAVPMGAVIDWYRFEPDTPVPDGFLICDGTAIADPQSPFDGKTLPDLTNRFTMGVTAERMGEIGGAAGQPHQHSIVATSDPVEITGGDHPHGWTGANGDVAEENIAHGGVGRDVTGGAHSHGQHTHSINDMSGEATSLPPPYVGMLKIMRVR